MIPTSPPIASADPFAPLAVLAAGAPAAGEAAARSVLASGGVVGVLILLLSVAAAAITVVLLLRLRRERLLPSESVGEIERRLAAGRPEAALEYCLLPEHDSYLCRILAPGLLRYLRSGFGPLELRTSIEEAGSEETARLYRATDALGVIGSVAPLLGLLGTVQGMIGAFDTVAAGAVEAAGYYERLAGNISLALITTLLGLVVAIPCVILFTLLRNRIDALAAEAAREIDRLTLLLETTPTAGSGGAA
jgi:biopolymer transport protein ExbB